MPHKECRDFSKYLTKVPTIEMIFPYNPFTPVN